jgi:hypothetical protein
LVAVLKNEQNPSTYPRNGELKLAVTQDVKPEFPGNIELNSDVIRASGMHHTIGKTVNANMAQNGPPVETEGSEPKGPPLTAKNTSATSPQNDTGRCFGVTTAEL